MRTLEKDILLICKGWYNKEKYDTILDALNGYYHREYGNEDIIMDKRFAINLFLSPLVEKILEIKPKLSIYLFTTHQLFVKDNFYDELFDRMITIIMMTKHCILDLSDYQKMFDKAKECKYKDDTIGII